MDETSRKIIEAAVLEAKEKTGNVSNNGTKLSNWPVQIKFVEIISIDGKILD